MQVVTHYIYLSDAILAGARLRPQSFAGWLDQDAHGFKTCALAAAYEAVYGQLPSIQEGAEVNDEATLKALSDAFGVDLEREEIPYPDDAFGGLGGVVSTINDVVGTMNDLEEQSREVIAAHLKACGY